MEITSLGIVALVFFVVPGFIADGVFRAARGAETENGDLRTLLRSLAWSTIGLLGALALRPKNESVQAVATQLLSGHFANLAALPLGTLWQTGVAVVAAAVAGFVSATDWFVRLFVRVFNKSPDPGGAWAQLRRDRQGRSAAITLKSGKRYWGTIRAMGGTSKRDISIANPVEDLSEDGSHTQTMPYTRLLYVREDEITQVWLSKTELEVYDAKRQQEQPALPTAQGTEPAIRGAPEEKHRGRFRLHSRGDDH
jgi:hypothetical protein